MRILHSTYFHFALHKINLSVILKNNKGLNEARGESGGSPEVIFLSLRVTGLKFEVNTPPPSSLRIWLAILLLPIASRLYDAHRISSPGGRYHFQPQPQHSRHRMDDTSPEDP